MSSSRSVLSRSFLWVPTLYLAMGIPYNVINGTAVTMFQTLGLADSKITIALGQVGLAWSFKPLWAAFLDMYRTKKFFVIAMEIAIAVMFAGVALSLSLPNYFGICVAIFWIAAFASSTQDICGDGIYLTALDKKTQANLAGVQGMFWNLGKVLATGLLITGLEKVANVRGWSTPTMWMAVWLTVAAAMLAFALYHLRFLPSGSIEHRPHNARQVWGDFMGSAKTFFHKRAFWGMMAFVLLYRIGEGLIITEGRLFMLAPVAKGGLGLTAGQASAIDASWGTVAAILGGILGGIYLGKLGLKRALPILGFCLNVPHFTFVYLSHFGAAGHGLDYSTIALLVCIEKFGYGFGFIGNMIYMMQQIAPGRCRMTHFAFATALMNFVLPPTTMISGPLAEWLGYSHYFILVMFASIPSILAAWLAPHPLGDAIRGGKDARESVVTVDDPSRLTEVEIAVQQRAGRASVFAMTNILSILIVDAWALGALREVSGAESGTFFGIPVSREVLSTAALLVLGVNAVWKGFLTFGAFRAARTAVQAAGGSDQAGPYLGNARGAKVASVVCAIMTAAVLWLAIRLAS